MLRASTYGRGLWQFALTTAGDFQVAIPDPIQTIFSSQTASFGAALTAVNGYNSNVSLSCTTGATSAPPTCTVSPSPITPSGTFTITANGAPGDYSFNLHAVGAPPNSIIHDAPVTVHIIDFNLTPPTPTGIGVDPANTSQPVGFQVTAQGGFQSDVSLSCSGLPAGATCNFSPSNIAAPVAGTPVPITLTISTTNNTLAGTFPLSINGSTTGSPDKTQNLTLVVGKRDYALTISNPALTGVINTPSVFNGSLSTSNGYSSPVTLSCGTGAPPACTVSPTSVTPTASGTAFTVTVNTNIPQSYSFNVMTQGSDVLAIAHAAPVNFQSIFDFSFTATPDSQKVTAGQGASYALDLIPDGGRFVTAVTFSCANLPAKTNCSFSPSQVIAGVGESPIQLNIATTATTAALRSHTGFLYALWLPLALSFLSTKMRRQSGRMLVLAVVLVAALPHIGCGGGGLQGNGNGNGGGNSQPGTTPGTYIITVTAVAGSVTHDITIQLTVQ